MGTTAKALAGVITVALLLVGCGSGDDGNGVSSNGSAPLPEQVDLVKPAGTPKTGGTLKVAVEAETDGWDPTKNRWAASAYTVAGTFYDPLVIIDEDFKPKPYLAESITSNADFTQWDMKLRPGVTFHDGDPLTATWVAQFVELLRKSSLVGPAVRAIASVAAIDDLTVRVMMSESWSAFPYLMATQGGYVPSPQTMADTANGSRNPKGTGAFTFESWTTDKQLVVKKNPSYWRQNFPYLDGIEFRPISDSQARINSLKSGDIDLMVTSLNGPIAQLEEEGKAGNVQLVHSTGDQDVQMVLINTEQPPMDDIRIRQAMAYALDRETLAAVTETPEGLRASSIYTKDSKWYREPGDYYPYDLEKAKALVAEYEKDKGPAAFTFGTTNDPEVIKAVTAILGMWTAIGLDVKSDTVEQSAFITNAVTGKFTVQVWRQFGASDPDTNALWWLSENASGPLTLNMARNKDPEIDAALKQARATLDQDVRKKSYDTVQAKLQEDLPYIWLSHVQWTMAANNKLRGIEHLPLPDGSRSVGLINGTFPVSGIWFE